MRARGCSTSACPTPNLLSPVHGAGGPLRVEERERNNHQQDKPEEVSFGPAPARDLCVPLCSSGSSAWTLSWKRRVLPASFCRNLHLVATTKPEAELFEIDLVVPISVDRPHQRLGAPAQLLRRRTCTTTVSQPASQSEPEPDTAGRERARERERDQRRLAADSTWPQLPQCRSSQSHLLPHTAPASDDCNINGKST